MGCKFCNELESEVPIEITKNDFDTTIDLTDNHNNVFTLDFVIHKPFDYVSVVEINYCPMCGKNLKSEVK